MIAMKRGLAEALVNAGRPAEAAQAYLDLAQETSAAQALDSRRRAAEQLLIGGHIKEGLELVRSVLTAAGFTLPSGPETRVAGIVDQSAFRSASEVLISRNAKRARFRKQIFFASISAGLWLPGSGRLT